MEGASEQGAMLNMMTDVDLKAASKFLKTLAPRTSEFVFLSFSDKKSKSKPARLTRELHGSLREHADQLQRLNEHGAGIFVTINGTVGTGRKRENFDHVRAVWADMDGVATPKWPLPPSMIVETSLGKRHFYWLLADDDMPLDQWHGCMARIVEKYGADRNATDPVRVLRLPGFLHCKSEPVMVRLIQCNGKRYSAGQIVKAFPPKIATKQATVLGIPKARANIDIDALRSALAYLAKTPMSKRPNCGTYVENYEPWVRFGLALKRDLGDAGFAIWHEWSRCDRSRYPGETALRSKWDDGLTVEGETEMEVVHVGSIFYTAQRNGWSFARYEVARTLRALNSTTNTEQPQ